MIQPGALVTCRKHGAILWVVRRPVSGERRWYLTAKQTDMAGRSAYRGHTAGEGDLTLIKAAPTFRPGDELEHKGLNHIVLADLGDSVELGVPEHRKPTRGTEFIHIPGTNVTTVAKGDIVIEHLH